MEARNEYNLGWQVLAYLVMISFTVLTIGPLIWLLYSSFKPHADIVRDIFSFPVKLDFTNYTQAWKIGHLGLYTLNSIFFATTATIITTFLALTTGYGIAKFDYKISKPIYMFFMLGLLLPVYAILVPLFVMETKIGIDDTRLGILLPYVAFGLPFLVFLATSYIKGLPKELEEAAIIDGASYLAVFWHVIMPVSRPVIATMLIFRFLGNWNEFVLIFVLTSKAAIRTLPVGINAFAAGMTRDYGMQFAALVIGTLPIILFYALFNKQIEQGFSTGALKE
jgi:raffinose/stachyose/melibiose transport system permease protein